MTTPESDDQAAVSPGGGMAEWPNGRLLSTAARLVEHAWVDALDSLGLTHAGLIVLHLLGSGAQSQTDLARDARVQTQTMSRTLDRLEREGLVARIRDERDARRHLVTRTDAGTAAWHKARTLEADIFPSLENADALRAALLQIIAASSARRW
ncbi:MarR family winged helix-turn-helix transcriptional regulator [Cryobacterium sp. AP23]